MNIRKLEDLSKDELIELIKQEREACGQLKPISVDERLPENSVDRFKGLAAYTDTVIAYGIDGTFIAAFDAGRLEFYSDGDLIYDVTHWLPLPRLP